jgi:hypothetical protein
VFARRVAHVEECSPRCVFVVQVSKSTADEYKQGLCTVKQCQRVVNLDLLESERVAKAECLLVLGVLSTYCASADV